VIDICHVVVVLALSVLATAFVGNVVSLFRTASSLWRWLTSVAHQYGHPVNLSFAGPRPANKRTAIERTIAVNVPQQWLRLTKKSPE